MSLTVEAMAEIITGTSRLSVFTDTKEANLAAKNKTILEKRILMDAAQAAIYQENDFRDDVDYDELFNAVEQKIDYLIGSKVDVWPAIVGHVVELLTDEHEFYQVSYEILIRYAGIVSWSLIPRVNNSLIATKPAVKEWTEYLKANGIYRHVVCSAPRLFSKKLMERWGVEANGELFGGEVAFDNSWSIKPSGMVYVRTAAKTSTELGDTVIVLDNCRNTRGAIVDMNDAGYDTYGICFTGDPSVAPSHDRILVLAEETGFTPLMEELS